AGRRREIDVLVELTEPLDRFVRHAVVVLEDAAHPQPGGEQIALGPDLAADEVGRLADALRRIDEDEAMKEAAMGKNRNRAERKILDPVPHRTPTPPPRQDRPGGRAETASAAATEPCRSAP